jgi:hypothetical protein
LVAETAGLLKPRTLTWKGRRRKAPDTPPMEVKKEMLKATRGGTQGATSMPAVGKYMPNLLKLFMIDNQDKQTL